MPSASFRLEPLPGYAPTIGRLVGILLYARHTTLAAVEGLSITELDQLQDGSSNSIGALLAHIAVVERGYHILTFDERRPTASEQAAWEPAVTLGDEGRRLLRDKPLEHYVHELSQAHGRPPTTCRWPRLRWRLVPAVRLARWKRQSS